MYRILGIIAASFLAGAVIAKIVDEVEEFLILDAGSFETRRTRKYVEKEAKQWFASNGDSTLTFAGTDHSRMEAGA